MAGPTIYNKVVEKMATGIARTASQRMITLAREYLIYRLRKIEENLAETEKRRIFAFII